MRAVSYDSEAAKLMGINVDNTISATFAIGSALAGAAGVIFGIYYTKIDPLMGVIPGLKAFVAAVLGELVLYLERWLVDLCLEWWKRLLVHSASRYGEMLRHLSF